MLTRKQTLQKDRILISDLMDGMEELLTYNEIQLCGIRVDFCFWL